MNTEAAALWSSEPGLTQRVAFERDVVAGLSSEAKTLPSKYFYDTAGSVLFESITGLQEYYVTRSEIGILSDFGRAIGGVLPSKCALVEFGSGSSRKLRVLLRTASSIEAYVPVDISADFLWADVVKLRRDFPRLAVYPLVRDFTMPFHLPQAISSLTRVGFFPGSTIGNLEPSQAGNLLRHFGGLLGKEAILIVGVDLVKDPQTLTNAYDDARGITARFNLNLLKRINRELDGNFDLGKFQHLAFFNAQQSRVEMHLVSKCRQDIRAAGHVFRFDAGESIHTEDSYKYTVESFQRLAGKNGWSPLRVWTDGLYSVHALALRSSCHVVTRSTAATDGESYESADGYYVPRPAW